jgi:gas vesicle protein
LLSPTPEDTIPRVEIKDAEIIEKIKETLQKQDELIKDDIKNNHETMKQLIQQVLDEIKTLSAKTPDLEVGSDEIRLSELMEFMIK